MPTIFLANKKRDIVKQLEIPFEQVQSQVIRNDDKYYVKYAEGDVYVESNFYWSDNGEFAPYLAFAFSTERGEEEHLGGGLWDYVGAFPTFDKALEAAKAKKLRVEQVIDTRNPHRIYTDGKGWSDGRP
jgi:hypothetical protein